MNLALQLGNSRRLAAVQTVEEGSDKWALLRDATGFGASESPTVFLIDIDTGQRVYRISYNGRVWNMDGTEYQPVTVQPQDYPKGRWT